MAWRFLSFTFNDKKRLSCCTKGNGRAARGRFWTTPARRRPWSAHHGRFDRRRAPRADRFGGRSGPGCDPPAPGVAGPTCDRAAWRATRVTAAPPRVSTVVAVGGIGQDLLFHIFLMRRAFTNEQELGAESY